MGRKSRLILRSFSRRKEGLLIKTIRADNNLLTCPKTTSKLDKAKVNKNNSKASKIGVESDLVTRLTVIWILLFSVIELIANIMEIKNNSRTCISKQVTFNK